MPPIDPRPSRPPATFTMSASPGSLSPPEPTIASDNPGSVERNKSISAASCARAVVSADANSQRDCSGASPGRGELTIPTPPSRCKSATCPSPAHQARSLVFLSSFRNSFTAAALSRRRCTRRSRTSPLSSIARHSQHCRPAIITAIIIEMPRVVVSRGRRLRSSRANNGQNFNTRRRTVS
jgi:hypothetical protein